MKKPFSSIFSRFFLASLIPCVIAFAVVLAFVGRIVSRQNDEAVKSVVTSTASHIAEKVTESLDGISGLVRMAAMNMQDAAHDTADAREALEHINLALFDANSQINCAWHVFSEGVVSDKKGWYARSFLRKPDGPAEIPAVPERDLDNPEAAPWHTVPFRTGKPYKDPGGYWDYGVGEKATYIATVAYPIIRDGKTVGSVGVDVSYDAVFDMLDRLQIPDERHMLLITETGRVVYSPDIPERGREYRALGFHPEDTAAIDKALADSGSLLREIRSPFFNDGKSLVHIRPVEFDSGNRRLSLYVDIPTRHLYGKTQSVLRTLGLVGLACLLGLAGTLLLTTRKIVKPLKEITEYVTRIAKGNLEAELGEVIDGTGASSEVVQLDASIRQMVEQLHETQQVNIYAMQTMFEKEMVEEASNVRTQFFASMSHEIRTPMNAIMGFSDLLLASKLEPEQRRHVTNIKTSSEALLVIINDILDISKLDAGKMSLVNSHFTLDAMLDNISSISSHLASGKGLSFTCKRAGDVPDCLFGDEVRIRQILLNLINNAVKFTEKGSVDLNVSREGSVLRFDVTDTGIGIHEEDMEMLFQAFKQVDEKRNHNIRGTGLGLAISLELATVMGGDISVESAYGKGSCFHVRIPLVEGDPAQVAHHDETSDGEFNISGKALVVDDNNLNLAVATGLMKMYGLDCDTASSGREAIMKVQTKAYDIVFMDHMMPEMDGVEATRAIRNLGGRFTRLPIIALTANAVNGARELLFDASMNDYLSKPIQKNVLKNMLAKWLPSAHKVPGRDTNVGMTEAVRKARGIQGLDVKAGLDIVAGDTSLYEELLIMTRDQLPEMAESLEKGAAEEDWERLKIETHGIKSSFASIGAGDLSALAAALEHALVEGDAAAYRAKLPEFLERMKEFHASLSSTLQ